MENIKNKSKIYSGIALILVFGFILTLYYMISTSNPKYIDTSFMDNKSYPYVNGEFNVVFFSGTTKNDVIKIAESFGAIIGNSSKDSDRYRLTIPNSDLSKREMDVIMTQIRKMPEVGLATFINVGKF